ncbi:ribosome small subunit-dependent GTPase A [Neoactinobaculum massilliense]|uniref:ribosome small subunit-dependent GTPase A n=1 Tax=Neoactinobaculum massilliense TaxID=2364794 RepID=UPI000F54AAE3|nr:ribosome small subunit-dependent GTPase A [Neoactinobaculum massilliense]
MRDIGTDDPRVRVRPSRRSRPRTKIRPDYSNRPAGTVTAVDRGRYVVVLDSGTQVSAVKARELGRGAVVVGDHVHLTGDLSGRKDTLARIALIDPRTSALTRSTDEGGGRERTIVANADTMAIVVAAAQPEAKPGMIDRCLVAAHDAGMRPLLLITKTDLASPAPLVARYAPLGLQIFLVSALPSSLPAAPTSVPTPTAAGTSTCTPSLQNAAGIQTSGATAAQVEQANAASPDLSARAFIGDFSDLLEAIAGRTTVLVGHSGVGKSTLLNRLVPGAARNTGHVNTVTGKGRHTSISAVAFALPGGGNVVDTPGVRSFGLAHVSEADILAGFTDLAPVAALCPRGCTHHAEEPECALDLLSSPRLVARVQSFRRVLTGVAKEEWE